MLIKQERVETGFKNYTNKAFNQMESFMATSSRIGKDLSDCENKRDIKILQDNHYHKND